MGAGGSIGLVAGDVDGYHYPSTHEGAVLFRDAFAARAGAYLQHLYLVHDSATFYTPGRWVDQKGGLDIVQADPDKRPELVVEPGRRACLEYLTANGSIMQSAHGLAAGGEQRWGFIHVMRAVTADATTQAHFALTNSSAGDVMTTRQISGLWQWTQQYWNGGLGGSSNETLSPEDTAWHRLETWWTHPIENYLDDTLEIESGAAAGGMGPNADVSDLAITIGGTYGGGNLADMRSAMLAIFRMDDAETTLPAIVAPLRALISEYYRGAL